MDQLSSRGKLRIFLGYADGVGKTYAMLEAGLRRKAEGQDVAVAWVETHQQAGTDALVDGLERIPPCLIGGAPEMDLDAVLARRPQVALVDDLAHRNAHGARHARRYQDVLELLRAGIHVYTTINVQHLESLNDIVQQITGRTVEDTVPDRLLDEADGLEMIDLPPEELLQRLREGLAPTQVADTLARIGELGALRQMALRETAERVDGEMRDFMANQAIDGPWPATERVMVCLNGHPIGDRVVRAGRRLAEALRAEWYVVFVETPRQLQRPPAERARLLHNLRIAEEMGAHSVTLTSESVVEALVEFSRQQNVTRIVIGKPRRARWRELVRGSRVDRLLERCGTTDVFVISGEEKARGSQPGAPVRLRAPALNYLLALGGVGLATLAGMALQRWFEPANLVMLYLAAVMLIGAYLGRGPSALGALAGTACFALFFDPPTGLAGLWNARHLVTLAGLLTAGLLVGTLAGWLRGQVKTAREREMQSAAFNALSRDLTVSISLDEMLQAVIHHVSQTFQCSAAVLLPGLGRLVVRSASPSLALDGVELEAAEWSFRHRQPSGAGTETFPAARVRCLPLETRSGGVGVLAVASHEAGQFDAPVRSELLAGFDSLAALAIERAQLNEQVQEAVLLQTTEKLQTALLNSISHDLRTPLSTVSGAISSLLEAEQENETLPHEARLDLLENADEEADRLNRLVGNLLDMTRLEAGAMRVRKLPCDVHDLIGSALAQAAKRLTGHPVETHLPEDLPDAPLDFVLMIQVLFNLLDNAAKYSPLGSPIELAANVVGDELHIQVMDHGVGIPAEDLQRVFGKFYRVQRPGGAGGTGLGLSICRGIVEVHGGRIWAENRPGGGVVITVALPLNAAPEGKEVA